MTGIAKERSTCSSVQDDFQGLWARRGFRRDRPQRDHLLRSAVSLQRETAGRHRPSASRDAQSDDWQRHAGGPQQLVRHVERDWGRDLTWQTFELQGARLDDLLQTPVLLIAGSEPLQFSRTQSGVAEGVCRSGRLFLVRSQRRGWLRRRQFPLNAGCSAVQRVVSDSPLERLPPDPSVVVRRRPRRAQPAG